MPCSLSELLGLAFVAIVLCSVSNRVKYYVKFTIFTVSSLFSAVLPVPLMLHRIGDYRNALIPAWCIVQIGKLIGVSYELQGLENINRDHGGVVIINHQSAIDLLVLGKLWPVIGRATQIAKREILYLFPFGPVCCLWGTLFIDRRNKMSAQNAINKESKAITEKKAKLIIFPEGTRSNSDTLLPFKKGSFHIAIESKSMIQPVVVSRYTYLDSNRKFFGRGHTIIKILPEISTKDMTKKDLDSLLSNVQNIMQEEYDRINYEVTASKKLKVF